MLKVGLTGGIGSGKSEVARMLASHGAFVIDADELAREVVAPGTPGLAAVVANFGPDMLTDAGELDRTKLASVVFADDAARQRLNAIVHPLVAARASDLMRALPFDAIVVYDVPLLVEGGLEREYDAVVVVEAPLLARLERLVRFRKMTEDEAKARVAAQASDEQRRAVADYVIVNDVSLLDLRREVARLWQQLVARNSAGR
jgi:dephospho-CoA kinase